MDIQQLRYFVEIVRSRNFTKAADKLLVTQPMLTRVVKQLEEELGTQLIERTSKVFRVTDAGALLNEQATDILARYDDLYRMIGDIKAPRVGEIRLSIPGVILDVFFPDLLLRFNELYPLIDISIVEEGSKLTVDSVIAGTVDFGIVMLPVKTHPVLATTRIWGSVCQWVAPRSHPLAGADQVRLRDLKEERFVTFSDTATLHDFFIANCEKEGFTPRIAFKSLMPAFVFDMVSFGLCTAVMPYPVIKKYMRDGIAALPLSPELPWELAIAYNKDRYQSYAARELSRFIVDYFAQL